MINCQKILWVKYKKIKALPVKLESDGGYSLKLLGKENDIRAYFHHGSGELKLIKIIPFKWISSSI